MGRFGSKIEHVDGGEHSVEHSVLVQQLIHRGISPLIHRHTVVLREAFVSQRFLK